MIICRSIQFTVTCSLYMVKANLLSLPYSPLYFILFVERSVVKIDSLDSKILWESSHLGPKTSNQMELMEIKNLKKI